MRAAVGDGRTGADQAAIEEAARQARAKDFIETLPRGYYTLIGEAGVRLSGGQQQRLALARTLLNDPPILVLDETTAMFDPEGETEFIDRYAHFKGKRTVILISHRRPDVCAVCDHVAVMRRGRLVADKPIEDTSPEEVTGLITGAIERA